MKDLEKLEPAMVRGLVGTIVVLLGALGLKLTDNQSEAIVALVIAVLPVVQAFATRQVVRPEAQAEKDVQEARDKALEASESLTGSDPVAEPGDDPDLVYAGAQGGG